MHRIAQKPLSVNRAYKGRKYKTPDYTMFAESVWYRLLQLDPAKPPEGAKFAHYRWGFSSKNSDTDNPTKVFQDILTKFWGFRADTDIEFIILERAIVPKGEEYIEFHIDSITHLPQYLKEIQDVQNP